jgi:fatty acid desaturase
MFESARRYHVAWFSIVLAVYVACYALLLCSPGWLGRAAVFSLCASAWVQLGLFAHEVGHRAVTRNVALRTVLGHVANSLLIGFSFSYWQSTHLAHHNHPNTEGVDPDVESRGFALYERAALRARGAARVVARLQPASLLFSFPFWGIAVKWDGVRYVARNFSRTAPDALCIVLHLVMWWIVPLLVLDPRVVFFNYAAITVLMGVYMSAILVVPHVGVGTEPPNSTMSFFERQVRFSRNHNASWLVTLVSGGLNLQIEHHVLPQVPYVRLRRARAIIVEHCRTHHVPYRQTSYLGAWGEVLSHLLRMSKIAAASDGSAAPAREPACLTFDPVSRCPDGSSTVPTPP